MIKTNKKLIVSFAVTLVLCVGILFAIGTAYSVGAEAVAVEKPTRDTASYTYNGEEQTYNVAKSDYYTVTNDKRTNAGAQDVVISLIDKEKYVWADGTTEDIVYTFSIQKATYSMQGVSFKSKTVVYDGNEHTLKVEGELPEGISVSYNKNTFTEPGVYTVIASFVGRNENYNSIASRHAQLIIRHASLSCGFDENGKDDVVVSSDEGIDPRIQLSVEEADVSDNDELLELLEEYDKIACAYDIKFMINEVSVQPDKKIEIQIRLSKDVKDKDIRILHIGSESIEELEAKKDGDYVTVEAEYLSSFVIVYNDSPASLWLWVVLIVVAIVAVGTVIIVMMIKAGKEEKEENK